MAIIFEEALKKNIKAQNYLSVYLLFGDDGYLKQSYLNKISGAIAQSDDVFNYSKFEGACDLQSVYDAVMQMPIMQDRKCVILNDYDFESCSKTDFDRLLELIGEIPAETTLIMYFDSVETDPKKGVKFKKLVSACEKAGGACVQLDHRSRPELVKMLMGGAAKRGCKMDSAVANYLVETSGEDINLLSQELTKLCYFAGSGDITKANVDEVCVKTVDANLFKLSDFILACNTTDALKLLDELYFMKTEPMAILYTVSGVFVDIYRVYCGINSGLTVKDIAKEYGYGNRAFLLEKAQRSLKKLDFKRIRLCLNALTATDRAIKSFGSSPERCIEELIVKLVYIISVGDSLD